MIRMILVDLGYRFKGWKKATPFLPPKIPVEITEVIWVVEGDLQETGRRNLILRELALVEEAKGQGSGLFR